MNLVQLLSEKPSQPYQFPKEAFQVLKENNYLLLPRFRPTYSSDDGKDETSITLIDLIDIGYSDLAVGRIYEGHINALLIIDEYGSEEQKQKYFRDAAEGEIFGIWNTEHPSEAMSFEPKHKSYELTGAKTFCSGGLSITRPIVTAKNQEGKQMIILEMENHPELVEDTSFWKVAGMQSTVSHCIDFTNLQIPQSQLIGDINDYDREPLISTGAIRFSAVQYGGAKSIADITRDHLLRTHRAEHPMQNARLAELGILTSLGQLWFDGYENINKDNQDEHIHYVNMVRIDIHRICEQIIALAEKAIGLQGFLESHPFEQKFRDLKVYLKQPNPDWTMEKMGKYIQKNGFK